MVRSTQRHKVISVVFFGCEDGQVLTQMCSDDDLLIPRLRTRDEVELEEEEYMAFLEREVGEDLRNLVVETNAPVGAPEDVNIVENGDKKHEGKNKKKGKKEREKEKEKIHGKDKAQDKKVMKQRDKKSKEKGDQEFLIEYVLLTLSKSSLVPYPDGARQKD